jgi:diacylglycerol kinase (ATP)
MARATLIHNTTAGEGRPSSGELRELVTQQGFDLRYATTDADLDALLQDPGDLVVVAGGDGTVGQVAARLIGGHVPLAILPVGTANNLAASLGITGPVDLIAAGWCTDRTRPLNVAMAEGPWGVRPFVESFGFGLFAHAMPILSALKKGGEGPMMREAQIRQDRLAFRRLLDQFVPREIELSLDGQAAAGRYLLVEALNVPMLGPRLCFAPRADPGDGRLEVLLVRERDRQALVQWLDDGAEGDLGLDVRSVRTMEIVWDGEPLHIDGETWSDAGAAFRSVQTVPHAGQALVRVHVEPGTVPVLVPAGTPSLSYDPGSDHPDPGRP